ncbi:hypothetical protein [Bacillus fonticola]|uniref:hypothetical protein n=1 Tax=Bacillus fonticola TaxID=2728853 RepID=UPI001475D086|nr:hypothetical protein [Bacillus fonticola]
MKFKKLLPCLVVGMLVTGNVPIVHGEENVNNYDTFSYMKIDDISVKKTEDGRIFLSEVATEKIDKMKEKRLDKILTKMGFEEEEVSDMPLGLKRLIVEKGGIKVKTKKEKPEKDEGIASIASAYSDTSDYEINDEIDGGHLKGRTYVTRGASTSTEYRYNFFNDFEWTEMPDNNYEDLFGWGVDNRGTVVEGNNGQRVTYRYGVDQTGTAELQKVIGANNVKWSMNTLRWASGYDYEGYGYQEVRYAKRDSGLTGSIYGVYGHETSSGSGGTAAISVNIGFVGLSWSPSNKSNVLTETWVESFTIGD